MDQVKIGKFIAELRKQQGLIQAQLGERLGVTNKTVSRWENGNYMPELALIPDLAAQLGTSVNELIAGERFAEEEYKRGADEQLLKNMQLLEEIREIKDSRWLSQGMGEVGFFMFVGAFVEVFFFDLSYEFSMRYLQVTLLIGLAMIAAGILLVFSVKSIEKRLNVSTIIGLGMMEISFGMRTYEYLPMEVFALVLICVGMLGNRIYFKAIDKLLDVNMKVKD